MMTTIIVIVIILALIFAMHFFMGKEMKIERSITIDRPVNQVFDYVKLTRNQDKFSTWNMADPEMSKEYQGTDGQVGFIYKWDSKSNKNVGAGEQEIKKIEENKNVEYEVRFFRPMQNVATSGFILDSPDINKTHVRWTFSGPIKFPMTLMKPVFQNMLGKDLAKGLSNLKAVLER